MATNEFLPFANQAGANVLTNAAYNALAARLIGYTSGVAQSPQLNKTWRQSAAITSGLAGLLSTVANGGVGVDFLDNNNPATLDLALRAGFRSPAWMFPGASGTNSLTTSFAPPFTSLAAMATTVFHMKIAVTNTGPVTLSVNSLAAKPIRDMNNQPLISGAMLANTVVSLLYNATVDCFMLMTPAATLITPSLGDARWVNIAGDVMTGPLEVNTHLVVRNTSGDASVYLSGPANMHKAIYFRNDSAVRWSLTHAKDGDAFALGRFSSGGTFIDNSFMVDPATGQTSFTSIGITGTLYVAGATTVDDTLYVSGTLTVAGGVTLQANVGIAGTLYVGGLTTIDDALVVRNTAGGTGIYLDGTAGSERGIYFRNGATSASHWALNQNNAEAFALARYAGGVYQNSPIYVDPAGAITLTPSVFVNGTLIANGATTIDDTFTVTGQVALQNGVVVTDYITIGSTTGGANLYLNGKDGSSKSITFQDGGVNRWSLNQNNVDGFGLARYDNKGTYIDSPLYVDPATGGVSLSDGLTVTDDAIFLDVVRARNHITFNSDDSAGFITVGSDRRVFFNNEVSYIQVDTATGNMDFITGSLTSLAIGGPSTIPPGSVDLVSNLEIHGAQAIRPGGGPWNSPADLRVKTVIGPYTTGLAEITALNPVTYTYTKPWKTIGAKKEIPAIDPRIYVGLTAQDVRGVMPETVREMDAIIDGEPVTDFLTLDTGPMLFALINAVKELSATVTEQGGMIDQLHDRIKALEAQVNPPV